jgi:hypothetical protein
MTINYDKKHQGTVCMYIFILLTNHYLHHEKSIQRN